MNKYLILLIVLIALIGGGIAFRSFSGGEKKPVDTGIVREFTVTAKKDQWKFEPDVISVNQGDKVILTIVNEDDYDHGIAIDAFGVSQRIPAKGTIVIQFIATQPGDFPFYCSVPCGSGVVEGKPRGHFDQVGTLHIKSASVTQ
ncbi:MAG: cupredoxin domain-containing protein [Candidatus Yonathbacteria bacterium]|nr:cupredoxin domain-containing protein [Candidatus Yonathbacteria bacterium]